MFVYVMCYVCGWVGGSAWVGMRVCACVYVHSYEFHTHAHARTHARTHTQVFSLRSIKNKETLDQIKEVNLVSMDDEFDDLEDAKSDEEGKHVGRCGWVWVCACAYQLSVDGRRVRLPRGR